MAFFYQWAQNLTILYPELYNGGAGSAETHRFAKKWGGYQIISELAGGDITRFERISEEPVEKVLLYLCYKADKFQLEEMIARKNSKK